ncbi:Ubiquitin carboxyl-terminal hydrolase family protein [Babesia bovis T2Bo]|uniref:Ubiquitin carboxyl-terminal hydrolase family protein n=1 Tax=Babesia bovis TaxID=5865 RepID=A7AME8_BABBO|nr:Ubiquitin carboxyl-terminal hydrolase family protein [Babesia bovis T2Bo]EDO07732.1 Ubiquitin carboxyl-terminal hydrolase family protein [Babesia bovis T2Bo]|eukprot:XP_001611300.1 ubiquitin carboxyl-terminal hydrolase family protein [Babesia bovis T2Bo]
MTDRWKDNVSPWAIGERRSLFATKRAGQLHRNGLSNGGMKMHENSERQPRLWSKLSSSVINGSDSAASRPDQGSFTTDSSRRDPSSIPGNSRIISTVDTTKRADDNAKSDEYRHFQEIPAVDEIVHLLPDTYSEKLMIQLIDDRLSSPKPHKTNSIDAESRETTADGEALTDRLSSIRDLEPPLEEIPVEDTTHDIQEPAGKAADFIARVGSNPFAIFRLKHARSVVNVGETELSHVKAVILSKRHSPEELHSLFKSSISVTNVQMMRLILQFLQDIMLTDITYRELCVRMMETALVYHPDELVQCFSCVHIATLFEPEVNDDVGGRFIRLFLSYKATFGACGKQDAGVPTWVNSKGYFCYDTENADTSDLPPVPPRMISSYNNFQVETEGLDGTKVRNAKYPPFAGSDNNPFIGYGRIESLTLLKICADRAGVSSVFDIPASRLRDWVCTIWYELPATRPCLPLMMTCINWINACDDPMFLKDAAFALLKKELSLRGDFEGGRLLMLDLLSFMAKRCGVASVELSRIVDMLAEGEDNILYAVLDSIISNNFTEDSMLNLWCLLCILPWPVSSPDSAICRLLSSTFLIYYQLAYNALRDEGPSIHFKTNPMGLIENALRICVCRCSSPILSKDALLQTILLVELSPLPAVKMTNAPLILSSLCPFLWKCHFVWSNCGRDADKDSIIALRHLYNVLRTCVFCEPLNSASDELGTRKVPIFPRVQFESDETMSADVESFIGASKTLDPSLSDTPNEVIEEQVMPEVKIPVSKTILDRPRGLRNLGNTCYYNSMLQALFHTRGFVHGLFELSEENDYVSVYKRIFHKLMKRGKKVFDPRSGYKMLPSQWTSRCEQQDVTETLAHVMEELDPTLSLRRRIFAGLVLRRVKCLGCGNLSDNREVVMDFTFPVNGLRSIQAMFDDFCKIETLRGGNRYFCSKCDSYRRAEMWNVIASPPAHLMIVLSRHMWPMGSKAQGVHSGAGKLLEHITINDKLQIYDFDYTLYGSIFHVGVDASSGHYYFVGRDSEGYSKWYICDDSQVREVNETTVNDISQNTYNSDVPYVLFYRCAQAPPTPL